LRGFFLLSKSGAANVTNQPTTGINSAGMNREMRRLAKRADKIVRRGIPKHGIMTQAQKERHLATAGAVISGSTTYEDDNLDTTLIKIYAAFDALKKGDGTDEHFDYLAAAINVSFVRAQDISPTLVEQLQHAQDAMNACGRRMQQHGKSGFTGPEMQHVALAIEAHEEILRHSTPIQMWRALRKVQDNYRTAIAARTKQESKK
jgi:hypothetical protein